MKFALLFAYLVVFLIISTGCQNPITKAVRKVEYSAYEMVGLQKRDLLKSRVDDVREEQEEAGKGFENALEQLKALTGFKGGELEDKYSSLQSSFNRATHEADDVRKSIRKVENVARDLFDEWDKEIDQIETAEFKRKSRESLRATKQRYEELHKTLKASEARIDPVLRKFNDQVLYLKHNLNAKAIASLKGESLSIQSDIEKLIREMNKSIDEADRFIKQMP